MSLAANTSSASLGRAGAHRRLAIEQRMVGLLALLGLAHLAWLLAWAALIFDGPTWAALAASSALARVAAVAGVVLVAQGVHLALRMPALRWRRPGAAGPSPWPLALGGAPSLLVWPLLIARDRRARTQRTLSPQEVELAFRELLATPRVAGTIFGAWMATITLVATAALMQATQTSPTTASLFAVLSLASLLPLISLAVSRNRQILVPELLSAPRPDPVAVPAQTPVAWRLGGPAGLALLGVVLVPALVGGLGSSRLEQDQLERRASQQARALIVAHEAGDRSAVQALLDAHPNNGLHTPTERLGRLPATAPPRASATDIADLDGDGRPDHAIISDARLGVFAVAPLEPAQSSELLTALALIGLGLVAGTVALVLLLRDLERDLGRATRQVASVANGEVPEPMAIETFVTAELRGLVTSIDELVGRITDANIHKYVLIEKGHEGDRLKSQFLANMSHDLRSPLNSVIGFSDLLISGIEGELEPQQLEMVEIILQTGRGLLQQIDDILDTAKIEAGRMELHREPTPPATLIARAIKRARARVAPQIEFDTTFAPGLPPAFIDTYRTTQALENVLIFAAERIEQGTIMITCESHREGDARMIALRIESPRALVPLYELEQARRGFFRLPGHTGLGLGLPIATAVIEQQGGKLLIQDGASSSLGGRAAMGFELRLPALTARRVVRPRIG